MASGGSKKILAIETSCDESAIAIADFSDGKVRVRSHIVSSQATLHAAYGGVVPNLARREHEKNLVPILMQALAESRMSNVEGRKKRASIYPLHSTRNSLPSLLTRESELLRQFKKYITPLPSPDIDAIAVTYGPGLAPALWVGVNFSRALAALWEKPLIPVNHMAGHFFSALLKKSRDSRLSLNATRLSLERPKFPILALLVSGGHTELVLVKKPWRFQIIGATLDDAVGEAYDKIGRIMGLPYPGGPAMSRLAGEGNPATYPLPSPMLHSKNHDFSFSGLKTAAFYLIRDLTVKKRLTKKQKADIAASFEKAAIDVLIKKTIRAAVEYNARTIILGGGVSANVALRSRLGAEIKKSLLNAKYYIPDTRLAGDNALMIAAAAYMTGMKKARNIDDVRADANVTL